MTETRVCCTCGVEKPITEFYKHGIRNGKQRYRPDCKACHSVKDHEAYCRYKDHIASLKARCAKCGETRTTVLDLHHRNPEEKEFTIGQKSFRRR